MSERKIKTQIGVVVSDKMDQTRVVEVERMFAHPLYQKRIKKHKKIYVHDPKNVAKVGDKVRAMETRPISKLKRWVLVDVVEKAK